jgi:hypothetical protein
MVAVGGLRLDEAEVMRLSDRAHRAHTRVAFYSAQRLTDGIVTTSELAGLGIRAPERKELLQAGLWDQLENAISIRHHMAENPSRAEVEARREGGAARMRRHRKRIVTRHVTPPCDASQPPVTTPVTTGVTGRVVSPSPPSDIHPDLKSSPDPESSSVLASSPKDLIRSARVAKPGPKRSIKTMVSDDWKPTEKHRATAAEQRLKCDLEAQRFRNYCHANGKLYANHDRAFDNWLISPFAGQQGGNGNGRPGGDIDPPARRTWRPEEPDPEAGRVSLEEQRKLALEAAKLGAGIGRRMPA